MDSRKSSEHGGHICSRISALTHNEMGAVESPPNNSKRRGGVMQAAPAGPHYEESKSALDPDCKIAAFTHGCRTGYPAHLTQPLNVEKRMAGNPLLRTRGKQ
jgi:hypothetical protein